MSELTREEIERGIVAKGDVGGISFVGCMCGTCRSGKAKLPCPYCKKVSGAPALKYCRECGYPLESKKL